MSHLAAILCSLCRDHAPVPATPHPHAGYWMSAAQVRSSLVPSLLGERYGENRQREHVSIAIAAAKILILAALPERTFSPYPAHAVCRCLRLRWHVPCSPWACSPPNNQDALKRPRSPSAPMTAAFPPLSITQRVSKNSKNSKNAPQPPQSVIAPLSLRFLDRPPTAEVECGRSPGCDRVEAAGMSAPKRIARRWSQAQTPEPACSNASTTAPIRWSGTTSSIATGRSSSPSPGNAAAPNTRPRKSFRT